MKREKLKQILSEYYSQDGVKSILVGRRLPSMKKAIEMSDKIPLTAWKDISSFISLGNDNIKKSNNTRIEE